MRAMVMSVIHGDLVVVIIMASLFIGMVIMRLFIMIILAVVVVIIVMGFEQSTFPDIQLDRAICLQQLCHGGVRCQGFNRIREPWRQIRRNPKYKIGVLQRGGL